MAAFVFPVLALPLVIAAPGGGAKIAVVVYAVGVTAMYGVSACYHRGHWSTGAKRRMRHLDHSTILGGIAATYTPIAAIGLDVPTARVLLIVVWSLAVVGALIRNFWLGAPPWLTAAVYVGVGWVAIGFGPTILHHVGGPTFALLLAGGAVYTAGAVVYATKRPDPVPAVFGYHEVFHALVLGAGLLFYTAVSQVVLS